jgi:SAM-dependent methyltransferase
MKSAACAGGEREMSVAMQPIRFDDGDAYERLMGIWSGIVGQAFLDWLSPAPGQRWADVGCGNGAFTKSILHRCAPAKVNGIDLSDGQLAYARTRPGVESAIFQQGDAMALPYADASFDIAVMALVIHFVPDPAKGVAEMARVVRPGGWVTAYVWDDERGGSPTQPLQSAIVLEGGDDVRPPSTWASHMDSLLRLWTGGGLRDVQSRVIRVQRTFDDFEAFWSATSGSGRPKVSLASLGPEATKRVKARVRAALPPDAVGRITYAAQANAVRGRAPG